MVPLLLFKIIKFARDFKHFFIVKFFSKESFHNEFSNQQAQKIGKKLSKEDSTL